MDGWVTGWMKEGKKHLFLSKYFLAQGVRVADRWEPVESPASCLRSSPVHVLKEIQEFLQQLDLTGILEQKQEIPLSYLIPQQSTGQ